MTIVFPAPIVEELLITIGSKKRTTWVYRKSSDDEKLGARLRPYVYESHVKPIEFAENEFASKRQMRGVELNFRFKSHSGRYHL